MIDDEVARDLIKPACRFVPVGLAASMTMYANESLLQQVFGGRIIFDPAADEGFQPVTVLIPDLIQRFIHLETSQPGLKDAMPLYLAGYRARRFILNSPVWTCAANESNSRARRLTGVL